MGASPTRPTLEPEANRRDRPGPDRTTGLTGFSTLGNYTGTDTLRPINRTITDDRGVVCQWHNSCFDLQTGEVRDWATRLQEDGTPPGWEFLGDVSKNRTKLTVYACRIHDGYLWVALD